MTKHEAMKLFEETGRFVPYGTMSRRSGTSLLLM